MRARDSAAEVQLEISSRPRPTSRRRVCVVSETYPPEINGVALTLAHLVNGLRARGHTVSVVRPRQRVVDRRGHWRDPEDVLVHGAPLPGYGGLQVGLPAGGALRRSWARERPDVVYVATEGPLGWSAVRVAQRLELPLVSGFHTNFHGYARHYHAGWCARAVAAYLRRFHNRTMGTVVATVDLRDRLHALGFANLRVLGRGVDGRLFTPARRRAALREAWGVSERDVVALYVGRIAAEKNLELAIDAYRAMQALGASRRFVLVGDGPQRAALQKRHPDLLFCGVLTGPELAVHYASADVFLFPSETETFGNVTLEAMASGLAVVAYDYAAARMHMTHGETGVLIPYGQASAFVEGAVGLARSPLLLARVRRRAPASVARTAWPRVVERFEAILMEALGQRREPS
jgi:glycosyltransferase involved in cell wall biosynthesis